jgi:hypothetical protein
LTVKLAPDFVSLNPGYACWKAIAQWAQGATLGPAKK